MYSSCFKPILYTSLVHKRWTGEYIIITLYTNLVHKRWTGEYIIITLSSNLYLKSDIFDSLDWTPLKQYPWLKLTVHQSEYCRSLSVHKCTQCVLWTPWKWLYKFFENHGLSIYTSSIPWNIFTDFMCRWRSIFWSGLKGTNVNWTCHSYNLRVIWNYIYSLFKEIVYT